MDDYDKLREAIIMAFEAHRGQKRQDGSDYIFHPLAVMIGLPQNAPIEARIVAVLHDAVEDGKMTFLAIQSNFGNEIFNTVAILTRKDEESYRQYIKRIHKSENEIAKMVKIADLKHNLNTIYNVEDDWKRAELKLRYEKALATLLEPDTHSGWIKV